MADFQNTADPEEYTPEPVPGDAEPAPDRSWVLSVLWLALGLAVLAWAATRAHSCGGGWTMASVRALIASVLSLGVASAVAWVFVVYAFALAFSMGPGYLVYAMLATGLAAYLGIGLGGVALLTRC